ncbi:Zn-ribbon domain-containing OB-fold protein [Mycobacterium sp. JS623]|uniref:Zn-ribbon domain-containing OB-fold protein n=1 Tax=Mycobacterium sp. JS623 TaxID=212767 RepID=UPI00030913F2
MLPKLHEHNRAFWTGGADGHLMIARCTQCELWVSPPAADCPDCGGVLVARPVSGRGTVFTYTVNYQPFNPDVPVPYVIAIVELDEQPDLRIASNIVDCEPDSVHVGLRVEVGFEPHDVDGDAVFVPVFAPRRDQT